MTVLKSRLVTPDGKPIVGRRVTATLMSRPSWISNPNTGGRALGAVTSYTQSGPPLTEDPSSKAGLWEMDLLPVNQFEGNEENAPYVWYQVDEGDGAVWAVRFDDSQPEVWLKDRLIDPPKPQPDWVAIDKLSSLHDVDRQSVTEAPDGAVLIKRGGRWVAEVPTFGKNRLDELNDVDHESMGSPPSLAYLQYLGTSGWGVYKPPSPYPVGAIDLPDPEDKRTVRLSWAERDEGRVTEYRWGDEPADEWNVWPDGETSITRTFTVDGYYSSKARYQDDPANEGWLDGGNSGIDIPYEK